MKKKRIIGFSSVLTLALAFTFFGSYYFSKKISEEENDIIYSTKEANLQAVDAVKEEVVLANTQIVYEIYRKDQKEREEIVKAPVEYVGNNRTELMEILREELKNPSITELEAGLEAAELLSFSHERVVIRKTYDTPLSYKYFLTIENSAVTVYYSDKETVYSYTDIQAENLPEDIRKKLYGGMEIESQGELFDFLETYSS